MGFAEIQNSLQPFVLRVAMVTVAGTVRNSSNAPLRRLVSVRMDEDQYNVVALLNSGSDGSFSTSIPGFHDTRFTVVAHGIANENSAIYAHVTADQQSSFGYVAPLLGVINFTLGAAGSDLIFCEGTVVEVVPEIEGAGWVGLSGQAAVQEPLPQIDASGVATIAAIGDLSDPLPVLQGVAYLSIRAEGRIAEPIPEMAGNGYAGIAGMGNMREPMPIVHGWGAGEGAIVGPVPVLSGEAVVGLAGSGRLLEPVPGVHGCGVTGILGVGWTVEPLPVVFSEALRIGDGGIACNGALAEPSPAVDGSGVVGVAGHGSMTEPLPVVSGILVSKDEAYILRFERELP